MAKTYAQAIIHMDRVEIWLCTRWLNKRPPAKVIVSGRTRWLRMNKRRVTKIELINDGWRREKCCEKRTLLGRISHA